MASIEHSHEMVLEEVAQAQPQVSTMIAPLSSRVPKMDGEISDGDALDIALVTPPKSSPRLRKTRSTTKVSWDLDSSSSHSKGSGKTVWNQKDTLDLIETVQALEDRELQSNSVGRPSKTKLKLKGDKWKQVAELLPDCWMSGSDRFHLICRGKFQELRRAYYAMLSSKKKRRKFLSDEVCQRMKDYMDQAAASAGSEETKVKANGSDSAAPKNKCMTDIYTLKASGAKKRYRNSISSKSGNKALVRRSTRVPKRSRRLEPSNEEDEMAVSLPTQTSRESRSSKANHAPTTVTERKDLGKRLRSETLPEENPNKSQASQVDAIAQLFKKNFDLLRRNIDFSTEYHLHKHLHKHFTVFEDRMTGLIETIGQKIDKLDGKLEEKLASLIMPSQTF